MKCRKAIRQLPAYLDRELTVAEAEDLERHLAACVFCSTELASLLATSSMLDQWADVSPRRPCADAVIRIVRAEEAGALESASAGASLLRSRWFSGAIRAAAAILFVAGAIAFSGYLPVEKEDEKVAADLAERVPLAEEKLIPLNEDVMRSYIRPSEYWLARRGIENRRPVIATSSGMPIRRPVGARELSVSPGVPVVDHIYFPDEGMPVESVIPVSSR